MLFSVPRRHFVSRVIWIVVGVLIYAAWVGWDRNQAYTRLTAAREALSVARAETEAREQDIAKLQWRIDALEADYEEVLHWDDDEKHTLLLKNPDDYSVTQAIDPDHVPFELDTRTKNNLPIRKLKPWEKP